VLGPEHPDTLRTINGLAGTLEEQGRYDESERAERELLDIERRVLGPEHPSTATSVYNLGCLAAREGHRNEALSLLREAVDHGAPAYIDLGIDKDPDLKSLHGDPRFDALVVKTRQNASPHQPCGFVHCLLAFRATCRRGNVESDHPRQDRLILPHFLCEGFNKVARSTATVKPDWTAL
jgi:hypothetical protein